METHQCRICLDVDNQSNLIQPCRCAGTAGYIHPHCLEEYIRHYPDRHCRVCLAVLTYPVKMSYVAVYILLTILMSLVYLSETPWIVRLVMFGAGGITTILFVAGPDTAFVSTVLFILYALSSNVHFPASINILVIALGAVYTVGSCIPPQYLLLCAIIGLCALYMCLFSVVMATYLDAWTNALLMNILGVSWVVWLRHRPLVR